MAKEKKRELIPTPSGEELMFKNVDKDKKSSGKDKK